MEYNIGGSSRHPDFETLCNHLLSDLADQPAVNREEWQKLDVSRSVVHLMHEKLNVTIRYRIPHTTEEAVNEIHPDLPWAEKHFQERISGIPFNPPPSVEQWPHHHGDPLAHTQDGKFDHTYPERMWPRHASPVGVDYSTNPTGHKGIRFPYGDLNDVVHLLDTKLMTRQAYLPIWFPEDTGVTKNQRVPCSLGYHFQYNPESGRLDCTYMIRSCDLIRHFRNDVYMAARLLQWICGQLLDADDDGLLLPGILTIHIMNLHVMTGDLRNGNSRS